MRDHCHPIPQYAPPIPCGYPSPTVVVMPNHSNQTVPLQIPIQGRGFACGCGGMDLQVAMSGMPAPLFPYLTQQCFLARMQAVNERLQAVRSSSVVLFTAVLLTLGGLALIVVGMMQTVSTFTTTMGDFERGASGGSIGAGTGGLSLVAPFRSMGTLVGLWVGGFVLLTAAGIVRFVSMRKEMAKMEMEMEQLCAQFNSEDHGTLSWHLKRTTERYLSVDANHQLTSNVDYKYALEVFIHGAPLAISPPPPAPSYNAPFPFAKQ